MIIRSIEGEAINEALMAAMTATVKSMVERGLITGDVGEAFMDTSLCMLIDSDGPFKRWILRMFEKENSIVRVVEVKK